MMDEAPAATAPPGSARDGSRVREITVEMLVHATKLSVGKNENLDHYLKRLTHLTLNGTPKRLLQRIQNLHHCPSLQVLYLYDNAIPVIENLDVVPQITHLHLQNNQIERLQNLEPLSRMEKLYLEGNRISRLEGLQGSHSLQELHLANQVLAPDVEFSFQMESIHTLAYSLRVLNLSNCHVASINQLLNLRSLEQLDLSKNRLSSLEDLFEMLGSLLRLENLDLSHNQVTITPKYRERMISFSSPRLSVLDKKDIDANQRRMMQSHLAHKFRKRQEAADATSNNPVEHSTPVVLHGSGSAVTRTNEVVRKTTHGSSVHQLRSVHVTATLKSHRLSKGKCDTSRLGVAGAPCPTKSSSAVALRSSSSTTNNNSKY